MFGRRTALILECGIGRNRGDTQQSEQPFYTLIDI